MNSRNFILSCSASLAVLMGSPAMAETRPTLQGLQDQINSLNAQVAKADPACADNVNRYVDCNNGTVTDTVTGLIWLKQADCLGMMDYASSNTMAANLKSGQCGLTDHSKAGDWRLPTVDEWRATLSVGPDCRNPAFTNAAGTGCFVYGQQFTGVQSDQYWSSSAKIDAPDYAWIVDTHYNEEASMAQTGLSSILSYQKTQPHWAWPVRGVPNAEPDYGLYTIRSQVSQGISLASAVKQSVTEYFMNYGLAPKNNTDAGVGSVSSDFVSQVNIVNGRVDITYSNNANAAIRGKVLSLTPYVSSYNVTWRCGNAPAPSGGDLLGTGTSGPVAVYLATLIGNQYLPDNCRPY